MLKVDHISKSYKHFKAVNQVSFEIPDSEVWALTGPNGAGKTTLLKIIAGLLLPDQGSLSWGGFTPTEDLDKFKALVHYIPQKAGLFPNLTVSETLRFFANLREARNLEEVAARFDLTEIEDRLLKNLSGGQKQKVVVAQAFLGEGKYLLVDEPTVNLDQETVETVKRELRQFAAKGGIVIISSHIENDFAKEFVNHRIVMVNGEIKEII
ncbi:heme ABC exporter ATP-binding protein CcmA [Desulfosporosinus sp. SYSU MS00001]|uniref:heme ABC exporter ATP-binding protein CcmA n=1 Tax=Desulfosporosinus sp. SYSU MS00001 TaxID=3416284 RepID=UPI003CF2C729